MKVCLFLCLLGMGGGIAFAQSSASSSSSDFYLSLSQKPQTKRSWQGVAASELSRSIQVSQNHFLDPNQDNNLLDTMVIHNDLSLFYAGDYSFLNKFSFLNSFLSDRSFFLTLGYERPLYTGEQSVHKDCWYSFICFSYAQAGVSRPFLAGENSRLTGQSVFYASFPISKRDFDQSLLFGGGASLEARVRAWRSIYFTTGHAVNLNVYRYRTVNAQGTGYNIPLRSSHTAGVRFENFKSALAPDWFLKGNYVFSLNFNGTPFHQSTLGGGGIWSVSKNIQLTASLTWGDYIYKAAGTLLASKTTIFNPNNTFFKIKAAWKF